MRKLAILITPLLILALIAGPTGCGEGEPPTPTPTPEPTATPVSTDTPVPTVTATPEATATTAPTATEAPPTATLPPTTSLPCRIHGTVKLNGASVPNGTVITATVQGDEFETTTPSEYGASTYWFKITPLNEYTTGSAITFTIDGYPANQISAWEEGGNIELNLTASTGATS